MKNFFCGNCLINAGIIGLVVLIVLYLLRRWFKGGQYLEKTQAKGKIVLITGANSGLGFRLAKELNERGAKVYMLCRDKVRGLEAIAELARMGCDASRLKLKLCDLASFDSIRDFAEKFDNEEDRLDILINNAAVWPVQFQKTNDGFEMAWQCNYLGHFLLTDLLLPKLKNSPEARIVQVSAKLHLYADSVDEKVVNSPDLFKGQMAYNRSKCAQVMHARHLTLVLRATDSSHVTINSCHPGVILTHLLRHTFWYSPIGLAFLKPISWMFLKTAQDGIQTPLMLALSPAMGGISGKYFSDCKEAKISALAQDNEKCDALYKASRKAVGLAGK